MKNRFHNFCDLNVPLQWTDTCWVHHGESISVTRGRLSLPASQDLHSPLHPLTKMLNAMEYCTRVEGCIDEAIKQPNCG